jgi:uncharacterized membrane protein YjgN (DUF898 family)
MRSSWYNIVDGRGVSCNVVRGELKAANFRVSPFPGSFRLTNSGKLRCILYYCYFMSYWWKHIQRGLRLIPVPWTTSNCILIACAFNVITRLQYMSVLLHVITAVTLALTYTSSALKHHRRSSIACGLRAEHCYCISITYLLLLIQNSCATHLSLRTLCIQQTSNLCRTHT